ncbi:hypothetical protein GW17_00012355 [Ensete ventricosum]|nr:hypothetical protein GW17_00012355 [Ensete ventricosum]
MERVSLNSSAKTAREGRGEGDQPRGWVGFRTAWIPSVLFRSGTSSLRSSASVRPYSLFRFLFRVFLSRCPRNRVFLFVTEPLRSLGSGIVVCLTSRFDVWGVISCSFVIHAFQGREIPIVHRVIKVRFFSFFFPSFLLSFRTRRYRSYRGYCSYRAVYIGPLADRYADRLVPGGTARSWLFPPVTMRN